MTKSLLDTDILSEIFKEYNSRVAMKAQEYLHYYSRFTLSAISIQDLGYPLKLEN